MSHVPRPTNVKLLEIEIRKTISFTRALKYLGISLTKRMKTSYNKQHIIPIQNLKRGAREMVPLSKNKNKQTNK